MEPVLKPRYPEEDEKRTNPIPTWAKVVGIPVGLLLGFFSDSLRGWGLPGAIAGAAIVIPVLKYRRYWHDAWFWMTMLGMSVLQVPLVILARPLMDQLKFAFNILFATVDVFLVAVAVNLIRPKDLT